MPKSKNPKDKGVKPPFKKVLIANRSEIAIRIMRTCQRMGIKTVAVYSEADASALHVRQADEAVLIGPPAATDSYLNIAAVINAAKQTGAQAIHPGYGFLAENPDFVEACRDSGITFIGPSADVIRLMGDKSKAKVMAAEAGLPLVPGSEGEVTDEEALEQAKEIGFPLMVKASHGGGGIGIRVVHSMEDLPDALQRSRSLSQNAFGASGLYLERYIERPSHIEVQVMADQHGNAVHIFERDCSIQRRNQKVIEETPCVKLKKGRLKPMYEAALALVDHIGYTNAGTVEFLVDNDGHFYFLEMNTRIQVEHPVTEMTTGIDIVEHQIRIAVNERLGFTQKEVQRRGHSIEARIYPEDPTTYIPVSGRVDEVVYPKIENIRIDDAMFSGYEVTPYYDAMMAKVISWGKSRKRAIATLAKGLREFKIQGITHNISLIQQVLQEEEFKNGKYSTLLLADLSEHANGALTQEQELETVAAVAVAMGALFGNGQSQRPSSWKTYGRASQMSPGGGRGGYW